MASEPAAGRRFGWLLPAAIAVVFLLVVLFAMLGEREDARRLPDEALEGVEQTR
ncbi:MAG: hypothetical protein M3409_03570 [Gemmatimonadota bacterium]|jgi:hypothetical protein|nr:hypothetical protein [Gemmatimonadota bacterium]